MKRYDNSGTVRQKSGSSKMRDFMKSGLKKVKVPATYGQLKKIKKLWKFYKKNTSQLQNDENVMRSRCFLWDCFKSSMQNKFIHDFVKNRESIARESYLTTVKPYLAIEIIKLAREWIGVNPSVPYPDFKALEKQVRACEIHRSSKHLKTRSIVVMASGDGQTACYFSLRVDENMQILENKDECWNQRRMLFTAVKSIAAQVGKRCRIGTLNVYKTQERDVYIWHQKQGLNETFNYPIKTAIKNVPRWYEIAWKELKKRSTFMTVDNQEALKNRLTSYESMKKRRFTRTVQRFTVRNGQGKTKNSRKIPAMKTKYNRLLFDHLKNSKLIKKLSTRYAGKHERLMITTKSSISESTISSGDENELASPKHVDNEQFTVELEGEKKMFQIGGRRYESYRDCTTSNMVPASTSNSFCLLNTSGSVSSPLLLKALQRDSPVMNIAQPCVETQTKSYCHQPNDSNHDDEETIDVVTIDEQFTVGAAISEAARLTASERKRVGHSSITETIKRRRENDEVDPNNSVEKQNPSLSTDFNRNNSLSAQNFSEIVNTPSPIQPRGTDANSIIRPIPFLPSVELSNTYLSPGIMQGTILQQNWAQNQFANCNSLNEALSLTALTIGQLAAQQSSFLVENETSRLQFLLALKRKEEMQIAKAEADKRKVDEARQTALKEAREKAEREARELQAKESIRLASEQKDKEAHETFQTLVQMHFNQRVQLQPLVLGYAEVADAVRSALINQMTNSVQKNVLPATSPITALTNHNLLMRAEKPIRHQEFMGENGSASKIEKIDTATRLVSAPCSSLTGSANHKPLNSTTSFATSQVPSAMPLLYGQSTTSTTSQPAFAEPKENSRGTDSPRNKKATRKTEPQTNINQQFNVQKKTEPTKKTKTNRSAPTVTTSSIQSPMATMAVTNSNQPRTNLIPERTQMRSPIFHATNIRPQNHIPIMESPVITPMIGRHIPASVESSTNGRSNTNEPPPLNSMNNISVVQTPVTTANYHAPIMPPVLRINDLPPGLIQALLNLNQQNIF